MIAADQPVCFPSDVLVAVSSKDDGTMLNRIRGRHVADVMNNRRRFCDQIGVKYDDVVYHVISYDQTQTFDNIAEVAETDTAKHNNEGIFADALYTEMAGVGLK
jgi:polyphenol oxidase